MHYQEEKAQFLKNVDKLEMTIARDDGVNRWVRFKNPTGFGYWFDLVTWPGVMCINGDCGTYVFSRVHDMFEFFGRPEYLNKLRINPSYWSEKVLAQDKNGEIKRLSEEKFIRLIIRRFKNHIEDEVKKDLQDIRELRSDIEFSPSSYLQEKLEKLLEAAEERKDNRRELWGEVKDEILNYSSDVSLALNKAYEFYNRDYDLRFEELWDNDLDEYTHGYLWNCYAIVWGIRQYWEATFVGPHQENKNG